MKSLYYLNKYLLKYKWYLIFGILFIICSNLFAVYMPEIIDQAADKISAHFENKNNNDLINKDEIWNSGIYLCLVYLSLALLKGVFLFFTRQTIIVMSRLIEYDLKNEIFDKYQSLSLSFYKKNNTGDLLNRISEDVTKVRMYLGPAIMYTINVCLLFILVITFMIRKNPELTFYVLTPLPILSYIIYRISSTINKKSEITQKQQSALSTFVQESFSGIRVLKSYNRESYFNKSFAEETEYYKKASLNLAYVNAFFTPAIVLLIGLSTLLTIYIGGIKTINGEIDYGDIVQFIFYINMLTWPIASLGWVTSLIQRAAASQKRINEFLDQEEKIINKKHAHTLEEISELSFNKVSFTYPDTGIKALENISFKIKKGQSLGIIGRTGSGKSTIGNLICRLYDIESGSIEINKENIGNIDINNLRSKTGYVPQDVFLFSDTISSNISFGLEHSPINENPIVNAAKTAFIHNEITKFPESYNTKIGERGITLSGGQKQRISIARAIIKKPDILILDDCLSAVDTEAEEQILKNLQPLMDASISIIIGHRVSSIMKADHIIVLDKGIIIEEGNHNNLIQKNGYYAEIHKKQLLEKKED